MTDGVCQRFTFDTYDRELERYGGDAGTEVAEAIFAADSRAVAELLALFQSRAAPFPRPVLAMLSIDDLLASLGLDTGERLAWYREQAPDPHEVGDEYRQKKALLRLLLGDSHYLLSQLNGEAVAQIFATRRAAIAPCAQRLKELAAAGELGQTLPVLCHSYVHLHVNRLMGGDAVAERRAIALLRRTREGLAQASFVPRLAVFD